MLSEVGKVIIVALLLFLIFLIASGSATPLDLITGSISAIVVALLTTRILVKAPLRKLLQVRRLGWFLLYFLHYFTFIELRAHLDVIRRILHPRMPIRPGIVRVPYGVRTDYAIVLIANSITNTPGTVVVDVDTERRYLYVHWINVVTVKDEECRERISKVFEHYASKIFD